MTERTPTDYALEFAEYMAKGAEQLIEAVNALAMAEQARDEGDGDELDAKVDEARQDCTEFLTGLRNDIHQFRTRRDRAARAAQSSTVGDEREPFATWANRAGYDTAHTYDTDRSRWVFLNPMTVDLWTAWQARAALAPAAQAEPVTVLKTADGVIDLRGIAEQAGIKMNLWNQGAASLAYSEGCEGVAREHLEKFAALYGFACWNAALEANPPHMQGFVSRAIGSLFNPPAQGKDAG